MRTTTLDPRAWAKDEVDHYLDLSVELRDLEARSATGSRAVVVGSTGPFGQLAGRKALERGGTSIDAAMTTALTQIALAAGSWVSYAGIMSIAHFDASTGEVSSLNAGYKTFAGETDPLTIPAGPTPSGRTALVGGFFAGVQAAHDRFGRLAWSDIFEPAIFVAENGFLLGPTRAAHFQMREDVLLRSTEAREAFGINGSIPVAGDTVKQLPLAETLRRVASEGTRYLYDGAWAEKFVEIVRREGGRAAIEDLNGYSLDWSEPLRTTFKSYEVAAIGEPDVGGACLLEGLNLAELAGIGDPTSDPDALFWLIQISRQSHVFGAMGNTVGPATPSIRATKEHAERVWNLMKDNGGFVGPAAYAPGSHSDFVAAVDEDGNVTAVCHSINTGIWGSTGIFVDGISVPDSASFQQPALAKAGAGAHLPNPTNPAIVLKDGKPVLASSSIGSGLPETTLQALLAVLDRGLTPGEAVRMPYYHGPDFVEGDSINTNVTRRQELTDSIKQDPSAGFAGLLEHMGQVIEDTFDAALLDAVRAKGAPLLVKDKNDPLIPRGYWCGVSIEPGKLEGARTSFCNGSVEAW